MARCRHPYREPRCRRCHHLVALHRDTGPCVICEMERRGIFTCRRSRGTASRASYPSAS